MRTARHRVATVLTKGSVRVLCLTLGGIARTRLSASSGTQLKSDSAQTAAPSWMSNLRLPCATVLI